MNASRLIEEIINSYSFGNLFWGVVSSLIGSFIFLGIMNLFKKKSKSKDRNIPSKKLANTIQISGCLISTLPIMIFFAIYILGLAIVDQQNDNLLKLVTSVGSLKKIFLFGFGIYFVSHLMTGIIQFFQRKLEGFKFLEGIFILLIITSVFLFVLLYIKPAIEAFRGFDFQEIEELNKEFRPLLFTIIKIMLVSTLSWASLKILHIIVQLFLTPKTS